MICSGVNRFLAMSYSFRSAKSYHKEWIDLRGSGQKGWASGDPLWDVRVRRCRRELGGSGRLLDLPQTRQPVPCILNLGEAGIGVIPSLPTRHKPLQLLEPVLDNVDFISCHAL
jgi:hypothetical protein